MITIDHEYFVSLEVAELLKEACFDWRCKYSYITAPEGDMPTGEEGILIEYAENVNWLVSAPTLDVSQRWLREVKHLDISIHYDPTIKSQPYAYFIYDMEEKFDDILGIISPVTHSYSDGYFYTYEEAQEAGIKKALEIILEKGK